MFQIRLDNSYAHSIHTYFKKGEIIIPMDKTVRIQVDQRSGRDGNKLDFFIKTNSREAPIVCPADNNGFPTVKDLYARAKNFHGDDGVHVTIHLDGPPNGNGFAINLAQPNMEGDFSVIPKPEF